MTETLKEMEALLIERIKDIKQKINKTKGIENKVNWGMLLGYEDVLDEIQAKLGTGYLDQIKRSNK